MKPLNRRNRFFAVPMFLVAIAGFSVIAMLLWNAIIPDIFHLTNISFWQAAGLLILTRLLFGFNIPRGVHPDHRSDLREKWQHMNQQERDDFRNHWKQHRFWWKESKDNTTNKENPENKNS